MTYGSYGYLWLDDHAGYDNEAFWGGLQLIPAFSYNRADDYYETADNLANRDNVDERLAATVTSLNRFMSDFRWGLLGSEIYYYTESYWGALVTYNFTVSNTDSRYDTEGNLLIRLIPNGFESDFNFYMKYVDDHYELVDENGNGINVNGESETVSLTRSTNSSAYHALYTCDYDESGGIVPDSVKYRSDKKPNVAQTNTRAYTGETMWEYVFVGGNGGLGIISNYNGGTPYTSRIIGTQKISSGTIGTEYYGYTRDDMVTSAGKFGSAIGYDENGDSAPLKSAGVTVTQS